MKTAMYDRDGVLLWVASSSTSMQAPAGAQARAFDDDADPNDYYPLPAAGIARRALIAPIATVKDTSTIISGLPDPCVLTVNGDRVKATGGRYEVASAIPLIVALVGPHRCADIVVPPVQTAAQVEAAMLTQIDDEREARQMTMLTTGGAKKYIYGRKAVEVERSAGVVASLLDALSLTDRAAKYPYAAAEAAITGEKLSVVLARFAAGLKSSGKVETIEARAVAAKRAVRAATTIAGKRAAANVNWSA